MALDRKYYQSLCYNSGFKGNISTRLVYYSQMENSNRALLIGPNTVRFLPLFPYALCVSSICSKIDFYAFSANMGNQRLKGKSKLFGL